MSATNKANGEDALYAHIINTDVIEVGAKLRIPEKADAEKFMASFDPNDVSVLFAKGAGGQLIVGSWWTAGGEADGLNEMFQNRYIR